MDFEGTDYAPANPGAERLRQPVLAQAPVAGTLLDAARAAAGAAAVIAVPAELESVVEVPSLAGLTQDEAKRVLENLGLRLGKVTVLQPRT
jgi:beta-lactam-binding protein with PASTA domain